MPSRARGDSSPWQAERLTGLKVAVIPPDVKVYQITAGEAHEQMDEWSETVRKNVLAAINERLTSGGPSSVARCPN